MTKHLLRRLFISTVLLVVMWFSPTALADSGNGAPLFETHCSGCHLNGGNIIRRGKNLKLKTLEKNGYDTSEAIAEIIANGKNNMSAFSDRLSAPEISDVADYVLEQAQQDWS